MSMVSQFSSPHSTETFTIILNTAPSAPPSNPTGQVVSSTTVVLSWGTPPSSHQNGIIRKYIITAMEVDTGLQYTWEAFTTELEIHSLHPFYTYQFTIAAFTVGQGPMSSPLSLQTLEDGK